MHIDKNHKSKQRLPAIEYIRGISMLGVIGIHVGSQYLMNPSANIHLVAVFEILTRFAVPIFFFISAFGLFYNLDMSRPFDYKAFMKRRFKTVLIPYLTWSVIYMLHDEFLYAVHSLNIFYLLRIIFFGLAKYHLYFLVILIWFYCLMPLWISIVRQISKRGLIALLIVQIIFDYFSSYSTTLATLTYSLPETSLLRDFLFFRLNYLILHYIFIFVLGGYLAVNIDKFFDFMRNNKTKISLSFLISLMAMLTHYYLVVFVQHLPPEAAVNIVHQLSPIGIFYTITASIFFFMLFTFNNFSTNVQSILSILGRHSYFAYLFHPLLIVYLRLILDKLNLLMTAPNAIIFYILTVIISLVFAMLFRRLGNDKYPLINKLTIGVYPK